MVIDNNYVIVEYNYSLVNSINICFQRVDATHLYPDYVITVIAIGGCMT